MAGLLARTVAQGPTTGRLVETALGTSPIPGTLLNSTPWGQQPAAGNGGRNSPCSPPKCGWWVFRCWCRESGSTGARPPGWAGLPSGALVDLLGVEATGPGAGGSSAPSGSLTSASQRISGGSERWLKAAAAGLEAQARYSGSRWRSGQQRRRAVQRDGAWGPAEVAVLRRRLLAELALQGSWEDRLPNMRRERHYFFRFIATPGPPVSADWRNHQDGSNAPAVALALSLPGRTG